MQEYFWDLTSALGGKEKSYSKLEMLCFKMLQLLAHVQKMTSYVSLRVVFAAFSDHYNWM